MNKKDQSASGTAVEPVTDGQSDTLVSVVKNYPGGKDKLQLAMANPNYRKVIWEAFDHLAAEQPLRLPIIERPAWKTIKLGVHKNADSYRQALKKAGYEIGRWANDMVGCSDFKIVPKPVDVELAVVTVTELGFPHGATLKDIYEKALSLGLQLCPPEVGPALRLDYSDQPAGEHLLVAMEPIAGSVGALLVFSVGHDGSVPWLSSYYVRPVFVWLGRSRWLFVRGK